MWKLDLPSKIKIFMCRACQGILRTKEALKKRCIAEDNLCPLCKVKSESVFHVLLSCKLVKKVWEVSDWGRAMADSREVNFGVFVQNSVVNDRELKLEDLIFTFWSIWFARNLFVFNQNLSSQVRLQLELKEWRNPPLL